MVVVQVEGFTSERFRPGSHGYECARRERSGQIPSDFKLFPYSEILLVGYECGGD